MSQTPATYALLLRSTQSILLPVGKLGEIQVQPGFYVYVGSAFGPGGLCGRVSHHLKSPTSPHWHIDYLRQAAEVIEVWAVNGPEKREHEWARALYASRECSLPLLRFGASDCNCPSHLFYFNSRPTMEWFSGRANVVPYRWDRTG